LGDVGRFNEDRKFEHYENLRTDYKIRFRPSKEERVAPRRYSTAKDFRVETKAKGTSVPGFGLGELDAAVKIIAKRKYACILQLSDATEVRITNANAVMRQIAKRVRAGDWELDLIAVAGRIQARQGFAAISQVAGQALELKVIGDVRLSKVLEIGSSELLLTSDWGTTGYFVRKFSGCDTPIFTHTIRVKQSLWSRLLPWPDKEPWLIDPAGGHRDLDKLLANLSHLPPEVRRYNPQRSAMSLAELSEIAPEDLFEEVTSLSYVHNGGVSERDAVHLGSHIKTGNRPKGRPGRKPKGSVPTVVTEAPDHPDPDHILTWRQRKIMQVIRDSVQRRGYPPSMREIGEAVGLTSTSSVSRQLSMLQRKGYLRRDAGVRPLAVEVRLPGHAVIRPDAEDTEDVAFDIPSLDIAYVPMLGRIAAGGPILAEEAIEEIFPLPKQLVGNGTLFLLKVVGDSMINAAIADGDWVVVQQQTEVEDGDIVAAMIDGEATVKTLKMANDHAWLMPHNPEYAPIPGDDATILGRVVTVLRRT